jgi:hypothetical protein
MDDAPYDPPQSVNFSFLGTPRRLCFEDYAQPTQVSLDWLTVMGGNEGAVSQFGDPSHLIAQRPPPVRAGRQTGDG